MLNLYNESCGIVNAFSCLIGDNVCCNVPGMSALGERLQKARQLADMSQEQLAEKVKVSQQALAKIESGITKRSRHIVQIALALDVDPVWLESGIGEMKPTFQKHDIGNVSPAAPSTRRIPVINYVQAGNPREIVDAYAPGDGLKHIYSNQELGENAFALIIEGDSMTPDFKEGDEVIIDPSVHPRPGSFVVAKCCNSERATFKKYRPRGIDENGQEVFELAPLNEDYATIVSSAKNPCSIVGTMVEHRRYFR